ncbi:MAG: hypothetical protein HYU37_11665 [Acidobacteria bacterium]|nr:hypothetical protein [Acidobacteriota bacterium]
MTGAWPALPYEEWKDTYATLHRWMQVVGKVALKQAPPVNHSWGAALHLTPRGLSTYLLPHGARSFAMEFDFVEHRLIVHPSDDAPRTLPLTSWSVADFYRAVMALLRDLGLPVRIWSMPVEIQDDVIRFEEDTVHHTYNPEHANRFWTILTRIAPVFNERRATFIGKASPVHVFWGGLDLAVTRFSGRPAPSREGPAFMRDAYSQEVISHGFWPGSGWVLEPAFYAYAVPEPAGLKEAKIQPAAASYHTDFGEFILPYEAVRTSPDPEATIRAFIDSTYDQAATLARWDRASLERTRMAV